MYERSDVHDEDLGIRAFQIKRAKAVERAIQLIRHGLAAAWSDLSAEEIEELEWILGELWSTLAHSVWDELRFGMLTMTDIVKMLMFGSQLRRHARGHIEILRDVEAIIAVKNPYATPTQDAEQPPV
jgi:hypothetical protein